jgi:serine/threonine protein kinase/tetratricopeptide (TPR) repeat protein
MAEPTTEFFGTERFTLRRRLGAGGMGVVHEAHDRRMDKIIALKTLTRAEAAHIYRFKREFRTLADVSHPNLVSLYELMSDGKHWFFTMELVKGVTFIQYVRPEMPRAWDSLVDDTLPVASNRLVRESDSEAETEEFDSSHISPQSDEISPLEAASQFKLSHYKLDEARLRSALRQLAEGVNRLHEMGKLHRDIKPSNVLVDGDGRVVILDFGLVEDVEPELHETLLAGTPDYMAPEQGAQMAISKASDWYSVGVMLYQALTGRLPFKGRFFEVMMRKQTRDPFQPAEINPDAPRDLNDLCMKLLRRDAEARPTGREVLRALGVTQTAALAASFANQAGDTAFVGRERLLAELHDAFRATGEGQTVSVYIHGSSGMGKTALVRNFLDQIKQAANVMVLQGRCYERESVPYKALDGVVDNLSKQLTSMRHGRAAALLPRNVMALARVFPVMLQVDAIFNTRAARTETADLFTLRRQAFGALRELLARIAKRQPLVIYIDDLQWADADSTFLIEDLLRPPDAPPLLLIASFRAEEVESKPFLKQFLQRAGDDTCRELFVEPLPRGEARELTHALLESAGVSGEFSVESIVRAAAGNPFLLEQLTYYAMMSEPGATIGITLGTMLEERIKHLPAGSREFLDTLAVAGRPVNEDVAISATGSPSQDPQLLNALRTAQLVRSGGTGYGVELYHQRIGETLAGLLADDQRRQIHRRLAQAIEARGLDDPEALYEDYLAAGERDRAAVHAESAAGKATSALAFDRAALFYRHAIELMPDAPNVIDLKIKLGDALANAGRPAAAAKEYLQAARTTAAPQALQLQQVAGAQLLMGGHIGEGLEVFRTVLEASGFKLAKGPRRALLSLLLRRLLIRMRGLEFNERDATQIPAYELSRIDVCHVVAAGLGAVDIIRAADFQAQHLLLALRAGELVRAARAISLWAGQVAVRGGGARERAAPILEKAEALAARVGQPHAIGLSVWAGGIAAYAMGEWKKAAERCERAAEILREECTGVMWELTVAHRFMLSALLYLGDIAEISRRVPVLLSTALEQGNIFAATDLRTRLNLLWLAADNPDRARQEVIDALQQWTHEGFHLQHYSSLHALTQIELYTGDGEVAWKHFTGQWKALRRSMLLRVQAVRIEARFLKARTALAAAAVTPQNRAALIKIADHMAAKIDSEEMAWGQPLALTIQAGVAGLRGDVARVPVLLAAALAGFETADMALYAAAMRRLLGQVTPGDEGRQLVAQADEWMQRQQIKNPARMASMLAPGLTIPPR